MDKHIIEIANEDIFLSTAGDDCVVSDKNMQELSRIAFNDILSLIVSAGNTIISKLVVNAITENGGAIIFCGNDYMPASITLPFAGHWQSGECIRNQMKAPVSLQKSLCKTLIQNKINNQALVLEWLYPENDKIKELRNLAKTVKAGDSTDNEASAYKIYFKEFFGKYFVRDKDADDINLFLNYIYLILRACTARAVAGAGLMPAIGIFHTNKINPFTLVDDLMEPYRPLADFIAFQALENIESKDNLKLTPDIKQYLTNIVEINLESTKGLKPLASSIYDTVVSLAKSYVEKKNLLEIDHYIRSNNLIK